MPFAAASRYAPKRNIRLSVRADSRDKTSSATGNGSIDTWIGRAAMLGFVGAVGAEVVTGKGILEALGMSTPLPGVAILLAGTTGALSALGVFRSASSD